MNCGMPTLSPARSVTFCHIAGKGLKLRALVWSRRQLWYIPRSRRHGGAICSSGLNSPSTRYTIPPEQTGPITEPR